MKNKRAYKLGLKIGKKLGREELKEELEEEGKYIADIENQYPERKAERDYEERVMYS